MKKLGLVYGIFTILTLIFLASCMKDNSEESKEEEQKKLSNYLAENNITIEPTESGLYYIEKTEGEGPSPIYGNYVKLNYSLSLIDEGLVYTTKENLALDAGIHDTSFFYGPTKLQIGLLIEGLNEGISMMKEGGKARMIIPSDLGYGSASVGPIPSYSTLIYDVELLNVISNPEVFEEMEIQAYLDSNDLDIEPLESGLYYIEETKGMGKSPDIGEYLQVDFTGTFLDGRVFDSGEFTYRYGYTNLIEGWDEGIALMREGGVATLIVPSYLAYGASGMNQVPPYTPLIFKIELIKIYLYE